MSAEMTRLFFFPLKPLLTCNLCLTSLEQPEQSSVDECEDWDWLGGGGIRKFGDANVTSGGGAAWLAEAAAAIWRANPELHNI